MDTDLGYEMFKMTLHANYFLYKFRKFQEDFNFINKDLCIYLQSITNEIENYIDSKPDVYCLDNKNLKEYNQHNIILYSFSTKFYCTTCEEKIDSKDLEFHITSEEHNNEDFNQKVDQIESGNYSLIEKTNVEEKIKNNLNSNKSKNKIQTEKFENDKINQPVKSKKSTNQKVILNLEKNNKLFELNYIKVLRMKTIYCKVCQDAIFDQYMSKHTSEEKHKKEFSQKKTWQDKHNIYGLKNLKVYVCRICKMKFIEKRNALYNHINGRDHLMKRREWERTRKTDLLWSRKCPCSCSEDDSDNETILVELKRKKVQKKRALSSKYLNQKSKT